MSKTFYVVNTVRSVHTRLARFQSPERHRFKQFILGGTVRLVRARPVPITEEMLLEHFKELSHKQTHGAIQVHHDTVDGPLYDFSVEPVVEEITKVEVKVPKSKPELIPEPYVEPEVEPAPEPVVEMVITPLPEPAMEEEMEPPPPAPKPKKKRPSAGC